MMNKYKNLLYCIVGAFIIFFIIFMRLSRLPAFGPIDTTFTVTKFYLYIFLIVIFSISLMLLLMLPIYYKYMNTVSENPNILKETLFGKFEIRFYKTMGFVQELSTTMIESFFAKYIYGDIGDNYPVWEKIVETTSRLRRTTTLRFFYTFYFLPPCLISLTYFIEVVFYNCFTYFPYSIFLMIFPLGIRVLLYGIRYHCLQLEEATKMFIKLIREDDTARYYTFCENLQLPLEERTQSVLDAIVNKKERNIQHIALFQFYQDFLSVATYKVYFQIFFLLCWLTSFSTLLYLMLKNNY